MITGLYTYPRIEVKSIIIWYLRKLQCVSLNLQNKPEFNYEGLQSISFRFWLYASETVNVLSALKKSNAKIGIISTKYRYRIKECLDRNLDENIVDIIIGGEDVEHPKPSPEGLKFAIKQLDLEKSSVLYIGDSTVDAETALHAAVDFAGVLNGVTTSDELAAYPHVAVMNDLNGLL